MKYNVYTYHTSWLYVDINEVLYQINLTYHFYVFFIISNFYSTHAYQ